MGRQLIQMTRREGSGQVNMILRSEGMKGNGEEVYWYW